MTAMSERPPQPPEGHLIARALKRSRLSGRKAADQAGMSEGHWRAIMSGSRSVSKGVWVPVRGPAETLARMAKVVDVTPEQLEEAGRADAAEELRELLAEQPAADDRTSAELLELVKTDPELARKMLDLMQAAFRRGQQSVKGDEQGETGSRDTG
jgi:transcriptional regulator with XRE-family HTH domain